MLNASTIRCFASTQRSASKQVQCASKPAKVRKQAKVHLLVLGQVEAPVSDVNAVLHALCQSFELVVSHVVVSRDMPNKAIAGTHHALRVCLILVVVLPILFPCSVCVCMHAAQCSAVCKVLHSAGACLQRLELLYAHSCLSSMSQVCTWQGISRICCSLPAKRAAMCARRTASNLQHLMQSPCPESASMHYCTDL
jgi:hypothetical protein